jgi:hypothetical protein
MHKFPTTILMLLSLAATAGAAEPSKPAPKQEQAKPVAAAKAEPSGLPKPEGDVALSGMSILGSDEAPKSLVIVPWKSSQLGDTPAVQRLLDDSTQPVDREVFMRELTYYEIKKGSR